MNGKMHEASAAMGLTSLDALDTIVAANRHNHALFARELADIPGLTLARYDPADRPNYQYVVVEVDEADTGLTRDALHDVLRAENVLARRYFHPGVHRMEPYCTRFPDAGRHLPHTEALARRVLLLPTGPGVTEEDIVRMGALIRVAVEHASTVTARLAARA
ncbi:MAG: DegT/DnrJ/EryC1/StrS family aminotransferase [Vicinamibacterales bacterium]